MRRFIKRFTAGAALLALLFALCSCMNMENIEMGIIINPDGSARTYAEIAVQKDLLEMSGYTEEKFFEKVEANSGLPDLGDWEKEKFSELIDGDTYTGVRYYKDGSADVLSREGLSGGNGGDQIRFERKGSALLMTVVYESGAAKPSGRIAEYLSRNTMNVTFRIQAPFPILETNGTVDEDGSVYWNMLDVMMGKTDRLEMTVSYDAGMDLGTILLIVFGALLVVIVVIVAIVLIRKRPKPLAAQSYVPEEPAETAETSAPTAPTASTAPVEAAMTAAAPQTPAAPVTSEPTETAEIKKFCTNCGARVKADDMFCPNCGGKIQ